MNFYMLVSFTAIFLLSAIEFILKKSSKIFLVFGILFFAVIVVFRSPTIVPDTLVYMDFYQNLDIKSFYNDIYIPGGFEIGFVLFSKLIKLIFGSDYRIYFFIIVIFNVTMVTLAIRRIFDLNFASNVQAPSYINSVNRAEKIELQQYIKIQSKIEYLVILVMYFSYYGFMYNAIVLRAGMALSIILYSVSFAFKGKWKHSVLIVLFAISFHSSAILGLLVLLLIKLKLKFSYTTYLFTWFAIGCIYYSNISFVIAPRIVSFLVSKFPYMVYSSYLMMTRFGTDYSIKFMFIYLIGGLIFTIKKVRDKRFYYLLNIYYFGLLCLALMHSMEFLSRTTDFFTFYSFILLYMYLKEVKSVVIKSALFVTVVLCNILLASRIMGVYF